MGKSDIKRIQTTLEVVTDNLDDLLSAIGEGQISRAAILNRLIKNNKKLTEGYEIDLTKLTKSEESQVSISGLTPGIAVHFSGCCYPIPGDHIVGIQNATNGIAVHRSDCEILQSYSQVPETWVDLAWNRDSSKNLYIVVIKVVCLNQPGTLAVLAIEVAKYGCNIHHFKIKSRAADFFEILIDLEVKGLSQLNNIISSLRSKSCVHSVSRYIRE